jgi:hypothetical protein
VNRYVHYYLIYIYILYILNKYIYTYIFLGTVINIADQYDDYILSKIESQSIDLTNFDNVYKLMVKAPLRLLQATLKLLEDPTNYSKISLKNERNKMKNTEKDIKRIKDNVNEKHGKIVSAIVIRMLLMIKYIHIYIYIHIYEYI